ncbi:RluA family pseudouridine synthase [Aliivibrio fischeri]|nr:RluA family pseudouridine synthase [Aliivibrio fischeri]MUL07211.1 RluA family pseudouridine synthase [Aliivibrio fischeri]
MSKRNFNVMSNNTLAHKFIRLSGDIDGIALPQHFTFPYYYAPHLLARLAMDDLQLYLDTQNEWQHDFTVNGKMFGVLVVKNQDGEIGYLASFSTQDADKQPELSHTPDFFVDAIFDKTNHDSLCAQQRTELQHLKSHIHQLKNDPEFIELKEKLSANQQQAEHEITQYQQAMADAKKQRKQQRAEAESNTLSPLTPDDLSALISELGNQSSREKRAFKQLKQDWQNTLLTLSTQLKENEYRISQAELTYDNLVQQRHIDTLKTTQFLNSSGVTKSLFDLFKHSDSDQLKQEPIANSSEQNCPKLLQAAFTLGYTPLALGEFWWGASPYDQIRQHKNLYPVCQSKCFEILEHMLEGISTDDSPLEQTPSYGKELEIVYEDDVLVVVNKPAEFLSVSGKYISDSVHARIQARYPNATGPLIVHRLDMSTSGLLVLTLTSESNKQVQKQFIERTVEKRYTALLEGNIDTDNGTINLPLTGDMEDRPRQMVSHKSGRKAETHYQVIAQEGKRTKVHLYPHTGRTHQLRVHCAHQAGLNTPIVGDDLYGFKADRLHLHAGYLKFKHPTTNETVEFSCPEDF